MLGDSPVTERVGAMGLHSLLLGVQDPLLEGKRKCFCHWLHHSFSDTFVFRMRGADMWRL